MDLISALPDNLVETILMKLPFQEAVCTSILSTRWRHSCRNIPKLRLDSEFWKCVMKNQSQLDDEAKFTIILYEIILLRQGPMTDVILKVPRFKSYRQIDTLISFLVRKDEIKHFILLTKANYKLPSSLFTCSTLTTLKLKSCMINHLPSTFKGFSQLTELHLVYVSIPEHVLESFIASCPSLEKLCIFSIELLHIKIIAPKLVSLSLSCLYLNNSQSLFPASNRQHQESSMTSLLGGLPYLRQLHLFNLSLQLLAVGGIPRILPSPLVSLGKLILNYAPSEEMEFMGGVLCLIRSSPNIRTFHLKLIHPKNPNTNIRENLEVEEDYSELVMNDLVEVKIECFVGRRLELKLVKLLLANSPSLKTMKIEFATALINDNGLANMMKEMMMFQRLSPNVQVLIKPR